MNRSEDLGSAINNLDKQFPASNHVTKPTKKEEETERKPDEVSSLNNNIQNQPIIDEENVLIASPDTTIYKNEPNREKFLGTHWKRRLPSSLLPDRKLYAGIADPDVPNNSISTSKYNVATFMPMNLFEQFSKVANMYFLLIAILQVIPDISNTNGQPLQLIPLGFIIFVSMLKDAFEDYKRHKSDHEENNKETLVYRNGDFEKTLWKDLFIGDIVKVKHFFSISNKKFASSQQKFPLNLKKKDSGK